MALSRLDTQLAIVLIKEALSLAHSTDPGVWEDWRTRAGTFIERVTYVPPILRADATDDDHPEDWHA